MNQPASDSIAALICGHAPHLRAVKSLAFLKAYSDDSGSDGTGRRLFIAGYLHYASTWSIFSEAWEEELRENPPIKYLHMVEANGLRGQFAGWTTEMRDQKLTGLLRVIRHFRPISFEFSISRDDNGTLIVPHAPRGLGSAHLFGVLQTISGVARAMAQKGVTTKIDFIFDTQDGVSSDIALLWDGLIKSVPKPARKLLASPPQFMNDVDILPLQAADMLAWHIRRKHDLGGEPLAMADKLICPDLHIVGHVPHEILEKVGLELQGIPGVNGMQSKPAWRKAKMAVAESMGKGYIPPYGTRWRNITIGLRVWLRRITNSRNR